MAVSYTTTYNLTKPEVGASEDAWGGLLNTNFDNIDNLLDGTTAITGIDINSGSIDGTVIGANSAAAITGTTITASTSITGTLATAAQPNITSVGSLTSLDVAGSVTADGLTLDAANSEAIIGSNASYQGKIKYNDGLGEFEFRNTYDTTLRGYAFYRGSTDKTSLRLDGNGDISFYEDTGTTAKFFWDASAESLGIGTSSPDVTLELSSAVGTSTSLAKLRNSSAAATNNISRIDFEFDNSFSGTNVDVQIGAVKTNAGNEESAFFVSTTSGTGTPTERLRVDASGNVGIGTSSPSFVSGGGLHVHNSSVARLKVTNSTTGSASTDGYEFQAFEDDLYILGREAAGNMIFSPNNSEAMRITSSGRVGIGTSSPSSKLHINTGSYGEALRFQASSETAGYYTVGMATGAGLAFSRDGTERLRIDSSGRVGIGTSSPSAQLTVSNSAGASIDLDDPNAATNSKTRRIYSSNHELYFSRRNDDGSLKANDVVIDSSGNLLVGTTDTSLYNNTSGGGFHASTNGFTEVAYESANAADPAFLVNNTGADGDIIQLRKDGTTVGSIGSAAGNRLFIGDGDTGLRFAGGLDTIVPWNTNNTLRDAAIDLGESTGRFKDLYLSGGVYLGGTGSANKLDDYEEGTWTPTLPSGGTITTIQSARYTKVGRLVTVNFYLAGINPTANTSQFRIGGLPYNAENIGNSYFGGSVAYCGNANGSVLLPITGANLNYIYFHRDDNNTNTLSNNDMRSLGWVGAAADDLIISLTYAANS